MQANNTQTQQAYKMLGTREELQTQYAVVKDIAFGYKQCNDYNRQLGDTQVSGEVEMVRLGSGFSGMSAYCYVLQKEGYEDLQVADWSGARFGIGSVTVACKTQKGYKAWRALLRTY